MPLITLYGRMTDHLEEKVAKHMCGEATFTAPSSLYLAYALYDTGLGYTTGWDETGGTPPEPGGSYTRMQIQGADWSAPSRDSFVENGVYTLFYRYTQITSEILFPEPDATQGTGSPRFAALIDAAASGNVYWYFGIVNTTLPDNAPAPGKQVKFAANTLRLCFPERDFHGFNDDTSARLNQLWAGQPFDPIQVIDNILNHIVGRASYLVPTWHLGLTSASGEPVDAAYSRKSMAGNWNAVATDDNGYAFTNKELTWGPVNTGTEWNKNVVLYDAATGGNIAAGNFGASGGVANGDTVRLQSGRVKLRFR